MGKEGKRKLLEQLLKILHSMRNEFRTELSEVRKEAQKTRKDLKNMREEWKVTDVAASIHRVGTLADTILAGGSGSRGSTPAMKLIPAVRDSNLFVIFTLLRSHTT
jgi:hypothetical protein